jgi:hypothetical protein
MTAWHRGQRNSIAALKDPAIGAGTRSFPWHLGQRCFLPAASAGTVSNV